MANTIRNRANKEQRSFIMIAENVEDLAWEITAFTKDARFSSLYDLIQVTPETHAKMVDVEMINHFAPVKVEKFCLVIESKNLNDRKKWSNNINWTPLNTKHGYPIHSMHGVS